MRIGVDGSRAFIKQRTGIEEYSYQVIKNLTNKLDDHQVILYIRENQQVDFALPKNWKIKIISHSKFWTQIGLSWEMLTRPVDVLFVPAHTVPFFHPKKTVVTIHGLEYEIIPQAYSRWARFYMRLSIKNSCRWSKNIISVSQNTKKDLMQLYRVPEEKMQVVYEGYDEKKSKVESRKSKASLNDKILNSKYLLFVGRLEERKNIIGIIRAFEILKEKYAIPHKLVLAGKGGYGFSHIEMAIDMSKYKDEIVQLGFVPDEDKFALLAGADVFMFPTFYEGFGIPVLEAQSVGVPVVTSNTSSMPEVAGNSAILVNPRESKYIAQRTYEIISDENLRNDIIEKGYANVKSFSWEECARQIAEVLTGK